ncbi:MAG TPA: translocation/assembly module TamB domain-containing protein [Candidatus Competibacteraceae bacterium]|nr:translocation/assembly module TamB domain-containing protein [Candidatus Competibacteraceae bacterium]
MTPSLHRALPALLLVLCLAPVPPAQAALLESTLAWLLRKADEALPGQLSYEKLQASAGQPVVIEGLRYEDGPTRVSVARFELLIDAAALLGGSARIRLLRADDIDIRLPPPARAEPAGGPLVLGDIHLPVKVQLDSLALNRIRIQPAGAAQPYLVDSVELAARAEGEQLTLDRLSLRLPRTELDADGRLAAHGPWPLALALRWRYQDPALGELRGDGSLEGELQGVLALHQSVAGALRGELDAGLRQVLTAPEWHAELRLAAADLRPLDPRLGRDLQLELDSQGRLDGYEGRLRLTGADLPQLGALRVELALRGDREQLHIEPLRLSSLAYPLTLTAAADYRLSERRFAAQGQWRQLRWPLAGVAQVDSPEGDFQLSGTLDDYRFQMRTRLRGPELPDGQWRIEGQGDRQSLAQLTLTGQLLEGELQAELDARWQPALAWQGRLRGHNLNPGAHWPELPGRIGFQAASSGRLEGETLHAAVELTELSGSLRRQALQGQGRLQLAGRNLTIEHLDLRAGEARLALAGRLAEQWELDWKLAVPAVERLLPGASGRLETSGTLAGRRDRPRAEFRLDAERLAYRDNRIGQLHGSGKLDLDGDSRLRLEGAALRLGGQDWSRLSVDGGGTLSSHRLGIRLQGTPADLAVALEGGLDGNTWRGRLTQLQALGSPAGDWRLAAAVTLRAEAASAELDSLCLASRPSRLCLQGRWRAAAGVDAQLRLEQLDLERFQKLLPNNVRLSARVDGAARIRGRSAADFQGETSLTLGAGRLRLSLQGQPVEFPLGGSLRAKAGPPQAEAALRLELGRLGRFDGTLQVAEPLAPGRLQGRLRGEIADLGVVGTLVPELQQTRGRIGADLSLDGTLPRLQLGGELRLTNGATRVPRLNLDIDAVQLAALADGQGGLRIDGSARSGPGWLSLSGRLTPAAGGLDLSVSGQAFQVADTPELQMLLSPDLSISSAPGQLRVEGAVRIPRARLSPPKEQEAAVPVSDDVVIINDPRRPQGEQRAATRNLAARVQVVLGEDVQVAAAGFEGRLRGELLLEQSPQLPPRGTGTIQVASGEYQIYGQRLQLDRGRVLFSGGPLDNPGLDLQATRKVGEVIAGVQIRGSLKQPQLKLFSTPAMPDASVLSYLMLGRAPDARSGSESALLLQAATALGSGGAGQLTKPLQEAFGLDTLSFEGGDTPDKTALVIGKYLSPDLYVSYGVGLFESLNTFTLRYKLNRYLTLESSTTGADSGADLLYTLER